MLLRVHEENPSPRQIKIIVDCLRNDGVIIYPTDTVYAMGCDIYSTKAIERIARIKGIRREHAKFSFICHDLSQLSDFTKPLNNEVFRLMRSVLPGPYTFILAANNNIPKLLQVKKKQLGIRVPSGNIAKEIVRELGNPIMSTSIHDEDEILGYTTDPELLYERYENLVDLVIDGGPGDNEPSTVIDCTGQEIVVIREGKGPIAEFIKGS